MLTNCQINDKTQHLGTFGRVTFSASNSWEFFSSLNSNIPFLSLVSCQAPLLCLCRFHIFVCGGYNNEIFAWIGLLVISDLFFVIWDILWHFLNPIITEVALTLYLTSMCKTATMVNNERPSQRSYVGVIVPVCL